MKKIALTIAILLGMTLFATAQNGGGLFQYGMVSDEAYYGNGYASPLGSGIAVLLGLGGAYLVAKKRKEEKISTCAPSIPRISPPTCGGILRIGWLFPLGISLRTRSFSFGSHTSAPFRRWWLSNGSFL